MEKTEPKFNVGDFVRSKTPGCGGLSQIDGRQWNGSSWRYSLHLRQANLESDGRFAFCMQGGYSGSWEESNFSPLSDPVEILRAEYTKREQETEELKRRMRVVGEEMRHLEFSLAKLMPPQAKEQSNA